MRQKNVIELSHLRDTLPRGYGKTIANQLGISENTVNQAVCRGTSNMILVNALIDLAESNQKKLEKLKQRFDKLRIREAS